jgi:UV DNA damage endonuclease
MEIIFGYACISELNPQIKTGSTSTLTHINKLPESQRGDYLRVKARANLQSLKLLLEKNAQAHIRAYRLPDSLLPMADLGYYDVLEFAQDLWECGQIANRHNMHLSFHPSQFFVLNSATPHVVENTVKNFNIYGEILTLMQLVNTPTLLTHVGARSTYPTNQIACEAFCRHYSLLNPQAQSFLAVENDQSAHSIDSCLIISNLIGIPVVIDTAHWAYKPTSDMTFDTAIRLALATWAPNRTPKIHISSELAGSPRHAHADFILREDAIALHDALAQSNPEKVIVMVEAKKKDRAVQALPFYSTLSSC